MLSTAELRALLADWTDTFVTSLAPDADAVVGACGRLPITLAMAGALVRKPGGTWLRVLGWLKAARLDKLRGKMPAYPYRNVYQMIEASVSQLLAEGVSEHAQACYGDLAVFGEDEAIPRAALCVLWSRYGLDDTDVDDLAIALSTHGLARMDESTDEPDDDWYLRLHDIPRAYVRACTSDIALVHREFVDAYGTLCHGGLQRGPYNRGDSENKAGRRYFFARLPYHLIEADRVDQLPIVEDKGITSVNWPSRG